MTSTQRDLLVLDMVFEPEGSLSSGPLECSVDPEPSVQDQEAIQLELRAIQAAESGKADQSLDLLNQAIEASPEWPSSYNNRAQLRRMTRQPPSDILQDLGRAIDLATSEPLTKRRAKTLAQAYTQRSAVLYTLLDPSADLKKMVGEIQRADQQIFKGTSLEGKTSEKTMRLTVEELATRDLQLGARFGNIIAKQVAVQTNPYAKLCGKIVREALVSEYSNKDT